MVHSVIFYADFLPSLILTDRSEIQSTLVLWFIGPMSCHENESKPFEETF